MNFSHFFIRRPIFAAVLSIVIVLVGGIAVFQLPIAQYPEIAPPTVVVRAVYPGANPKVLAETVVTPIEQEVNGVRFSRRSCPSSSCWWAGSRCSNCPSRNILKSHRL